MAACKSMSDAAHGVPGSSMVTVMARNGVNFGIRLSGTGDQWFQAPANPVDGLYFPGYTVEDAAADLGDSAITETNGLGGFAMAASPAIVQFVGGTPADATANSRRMLSITLGSNPAFTLPRAQLRRHARGHRRAAGGRLRRPADHQHRDRPQEGRRRPDRRRHHHRADGVLQPGPRGTRQGTRRSRRCSMSTGEVLLAVNGTLMRGLKLNPNMIAAEGDVRSGGDDRAARIGSGPSTTSIPRWSA